MSIVITAPRPDHRPLFTRRPSAPARRIPSLSGLRLRARRTPAPAVSAAPRSSRLRLTRRGRFVFLGLPVLSAVAALVALALIALTPGTAAAGSSADGTPTHQVTVAPGDTLWDVAAEADPHADTRDVMAEIADLNGLHDSAIAPGQVLIVPSAK